MSSTTVDVFADTLEAARARLRPGVRRELAATAADAESKAIGYYDQRLKRRTGRLARTIAGSVADASDGFELALRGGGLGRGTQEVRYGRIQELGGTVRPTGGRRFLAIPVGPALTRAGVPRYASPRDVGDLRFVAIRGGAAGLLVKDIPGRGKAGKGARSEIWFRLVRSVTIKPKYFLRDGWADASSGLGDRLSGVLARALGEA